MTITLATEIHPHVAETIEPGAILYSSWGYDQTNVDFYMVTRTTASSCWTVPMSQVEELGEGYGPMAGHTTPLEPLPCRTPRRHKIIRCTSSESISLTSFCGAYLWDGKAKYASHYA